MRLTSNPASMAGFDHPCHRLAIDAACIRPTHCEHIVPLAAPLILPRTRFLHHLSIFVGAFAPQDAQRVLVVVAHWNPLFSRTYRH